VNVLVVAPHPDDEVLGCGGTIHRLAAEGHCVTVAIVTRGWSPLFSDQQVEQVRAEARRANKDLLGVTDLQFLDLPVTGLKDLPAHKINAAFDRLIASVQPQWVLLPFAHDRHQDHRQTFEAASVALRPTTTDPTVTTIACYETPSETHWQLPGVEPTFQPNWFINITDHLEPKLEALSCYRSQLQQGSSPPARQPHAVRALSVWRGATVGYSAAEAFVIVRHLTPQTS